MAERIKDLEQAMKAVIEESKVIADELEQKKMESKPVSERSIKVTGGFNIINTGTGSQTVVVPENQDAQDQP